MATEFMKGFGLLFYAVSPNETTFEKVQDMPKPDYITQAAPYFFSLMAIEQLVLKYQGKEGIRFNDAIMSISNGLMMVLKDIFLRGMVVMVYMHIHQNYRLVDLPWDSLSTWVIAALFADFSYYWVHRAAHELNILWAAHQVHHSSEEYNLTTAIRQSVMQFFGALPFYLPVALFVPPTHMLVHIQFNTLFQFWIHTEAVNTIGPLEHILNTPQHHRVHHGSNRYCLDKNYAGALIIWDRLFGTFEWERKDEKIVYGLVDQPQFYDPMKHQAFYYGKILEKAETMDNFMDKVWCFLKGPGWFPGTERLGDNNMVPEIQYRQKYNPIISWWLTLYVIVQFIVTLYISVIDVVRLSDEASQLTVLGVCFFLFWTLTSIGQIYDGTPLAWKSELVRAIFMLALHETVSQSWGLVTIPVPLMRLILGGTAAIALAMIATGGGKPQKASAAASAAANGVQQQQANGHSHANGKKAN